MNENQNELLKPVGENFHLYPDKKVQKTTRLLSQQEKDIFSPKALSFLLNLLYTGKIDKSTFETSLEICNGYRTFFDNRIRLNMLKNILSSIILQSDTKDFSLKDILVFLEKQQNLRVH